MLRPREVSLGRIDGDADDLGVERGVFRLFIPELGEFALSAAGERLDEERHHDEVARGKRVGQPEGAAVLIPERDLRRLVVDRERRVTIRRERRPHQERGHQRDQRAQEPSTACSTAPRKSGSGKAPSN